MKRTLRFLFNRIWMYDRLMIPIIAVFSVLFAIYPFVWLIVPKYIIDRAGSGNISAIVLAAIAGGAVAGLSVLATNFLRGNYRMRMNNVRYFLIRDLLRASLQMPYEMTLAPETLDEIHTIQYTVTNPREGAGGIILLLLQLFGGLLASIGLMGLMSTLSVWVMLIMLLIVILTFIMHNKADQFEEKQWDRQYPEYRRFQGLMDFSIDPANGKDIRLYGLFPILKSYAAESTNRAVVIINAIQSRRFTSQAIVALLDFVRDGLLYSWLILQFLNEKLSPSDFYLYTTGITAFVVFLQSSMKDMASIKRESSKFMRYLNFMDKIDNKIRQQSEADEQARISSGGAGINISEAPSLELKDVSFTYPGSDRAVLKHLNLSIPAGQKLALVGENGTGKSTLVKLLCRLYRPDSGLILLNGRPVDQYTEEEYHKLLSVVFQDAMVFPFSISDNITLQSAPDEAKLRCVLESSGLAEHIESLPLKEKTILLRILDDDGIDLSGGQRQKMYLARALYKGGSVILLDEPSAALDPLAEYELYRKYDDLTRGKTSIFISHRLSSTRFCDRIALLKDGSIKELGTHEELMALDGEYARLFEIQAKYYAEQSNTPKPEELEELYA